MLHCLQSLETVKSDWSALFEVYPFFEVYKNYLQIDITANDDDDLRRWKGWVESRLRQLTLKVTVTQSQLKFLFDMVFVYLQLLCLLHQGDKFCKCFG
jgi:poly(A) polymerase